MIDERREAQASLYALGALPLEETREFETALRGDLRLQLLLAELSGAADAMVAAFPRLEPPVALKGKLFAAVDQRMIAVPWTAGEVRPDAAAGPTWLPWAVAAGFSGLCVVLIFLGQSFRQQNAGLVQQVGVLKEQFGQLQAERDTLQAQVDQVSTNYGQLNSDFQKQLADKTAEFQRQKADLQKQLEQHAADSQRQITVLKRQLFQSSSDKDRLNQQLADAWSSLNKDPFAQLRMATLKPSTDAPSRAVAASLWDIAAQKGMFVVEGLPLLPSSRTYQLWLFDAKSPANPVNAGLFNVDEQGTARIQFTRLAARVEELSRVAISSERRGGAATPTRIILTSSP